MKVRIIGIFTSIVIVSACKNNIDQENPRASLSSSEHSESSQIVRESDQQKSTRIEIPNNGGNGVTTVELSLFCGVIGVPDTEVRVGCRLNDEKGQRFETKKIANFQNSYRSILSLSPPELQTKKETSVEVTEWDIIFDFRGYDPVMLLKIATATTYLYEWTDANGTKEILEFNPDPAEFDVKTASFCTGVTINEVCYFRSTSSCSTICSSRGAIPDPLFIQRLTGNSGLCMSIHRQLHGSNQNFIYTSGTATTSGLGCYALGTSYYFNGESIDLDLEPPPGGHMICSCSSQ